MKRSIIIQGFKNLLQYALKTRNPILFRYAKENLKLWQGEKSCGSPSIELPPK